MELAWNPGFRVYNFFFTTKPGSTYNTRQNPLRARLYYSPDRVFARNPHPGKHAFNNLPQGHSATEATYRKLFFCDVLESIWRDKKRGGELTLNCASRIRRDRFDSVVTQRTSAARRLGSTLRDTFDIFNFTWMYPFSVSMHSYRVWSETSLNSQKAAPVHNANTFPLANALQFLERAFLILVFHQRNIRRISERKTGVTPLSGVW